MQEKENILNLLSKTKEALKDRDANKISSLSNQTTNTAALTHDPDNIAIAVIIYSLSKILQRPGYSRLSGWDKFYANYRTLIENTILAIQKDDEKGLRQNLEAINKSIEKLSGKLKIYVSDIFRKARINKASKIYEHGISMEKTAKLLGITLYELSSYVGQKNIDYKDGPKITDVQTRIKIAMDMFR